MIGKLTLLVAAGLLALTACGGDSDTDAGRPPPPSARQQLEDQINGLPAFYDGRSADIGRVLFAAMEVAGVPPGDEGIDQVRISVVGFQDTYGTEGFPLLECVAETPPSDVDGRTFEELADACSRTLVPRVHDQ